VLDADWANMLQEELIAVVVAAGLTPSKTNRAQVRDALAVLYFNSTTSVASTAEAQSLTANNKVITPLRLSEAFKGANQSLAASGYQKLPGGLILQWGTFTSNASNTTGTPQLIALPITFPNAIVYAAPSHDGGNSGGVEDSSIDFATAGKTTTSQLGIYSNYTGILKFIAIGY